MNGECSGEAEQQLSEIDMEIAMVKAQIDEEYFQLGKAVYEIADQDAGKIGVLVDRLIELKKTRKAYSAGRRDADED